MKDLINIKSNNNKCYLRCDIRNLSPLKMKPEKKAKTDKTMVNYLHYEDTEFPVYRKKLLQD